MILAGLLVVAGLVAASTFSVNQRADTATLFAERNSVGEGLVVGSAPIWVTKMARGASGLQASPVELGAPGAEARPALPIDTWVYSVTLREASAASIPSGVFIAELFIDEVSAGSVYVAQNAANATLVESARLSFPIGPTLSTSALYYLVVRPFVQTGPTITYTLQSTPSADNTWTGVGGDIAGVVNPALSVPVGATLQLVARNGDGVTHDIGLKDAAGALVNPPGWSPDIESIGSEQTIAWSAAAGTYTYLCKYHASTMKGTITVA